jgi:beta-galactosidase/beta-glucuronidase
MTEASTPRPEYPRPQFLRESWINLNGTWKFAFDFGNSGDQAGWSADPSSFDQNITVPFCPESVLSGIGHTDFIPVCWYARTFETPSEWSDKRVLVHFGGSDYDTRVWVNGQSVGRHYGGGASFTFDITNALTNGENLFVVCAHDDVRSGIQPGGKQCPDLHSRRCHYTRTTGIWQTVWLESVPNVNLHSVRIVPDLDGSRFVLTPSLSHDARDHTVRAILLDDGNEIGGAEAPALNGGAFSVKLRNAKPWSLDDPHLYDIRFELLSGTEVVDSVTSYAGLRKFHTEGNRFFFNNEPFFIRFVLDQGFYPDGIWTAPTDAALKQDIELAMAVGFNGARLHQKVFEERFHYWADKLGYLTWGEFYDWGLDMGQPQANHNQQREWAEIVMRDRNHPSIVAWTPFNETIGNARNHFEAHRRTVEETYALTKRLDPTRPVNDTSGYVHVRTDIFTVHDYQQDVDEFAKKYESVAPDNRESHRQHEELSVPYAGQPYVVDEYGGTWWSESEAEKAKQQDGDRKGSWGYGNRPTEVEEVYQRIEGLTKALTDHPNISGYTYTQLTDVEQEQNGIYHYDRTPKFDAERLKKAFGADAAIEKQDK